MKKKNYRDEKRIQNSIYRFILTSNNGRNRSITTRPSSPPAQDASIPLPPTVRTIRRRDKRKMHRVGKNSKGEKDARIGICLCTERESERAIERQSERGLVREREE